MKNQEHFQRWDHSSTIHMIHMNPYDKISGFKIHFFKCDLWIIWVMLGYVP